MAILVFDAMEGDSEKAKISYFHHWIDSAGEAQIESWISKGILLKPEDYEKLNQDQKKGKYFSGCRESYFTLFESLLVPKSNPLLAIKELYTIKQGSMTSGEFHSYITKVVKRWVFPNEEAEERAIRDVLFLGMSSTKARDIAINLMNEEGKELAVGFLINHLEIEDCNSHHKSLSQLDSTTSVNFASCDRRQNRGSKRKKNTRNGKSVAQKQAREQRSSNSAHQSRKPPGMERKCLRRGKHECQPGQKCPAKNAKCKACHKIGHFHKVSMTTKRQQGATKMVAMAQVAQDYADTYIDELGDRQPNPPRVNMIRVMMHQCKESQQKRTLVRSRTDLETSCMCKV